MSRAHEVEERAALWVLRREEPSWSATDEAELDHWLAQSDAHKAAFWRLEHGWRQADRIASLGEAPQASPRPSNRARWWAPLAAAASLALIVSAVTLQGPDLPFSRERVEEARFETPVGGRKYVSLPDGSRVELNTNTAIRAALSDSGRELWLERGEAYFDVARDARRRFVIHAGLRTITVVGTKFAVRRGDDEVRVAVLEGRIRVDDPAAGDADRSTTITAGGVAIARGRSTLVRSSSADAVQAQLAWRGGMLVFDETTLAEAAEQFNRYNRKQLVVTDPKAARTRIGGSFQATNVEAFVRLLEDAYGLNVETNDERIEISG